MDNPDISSDPYPLQVARSQSSAEGSTTHAHVHLVQKQKTQTNNLSSDSLVKLSPTLLLEINFTMLLGCYPFS